MNTRHLADDRLVELLVRQATEGVSAAERLEIQNLFARYPDEDRELIERTAAAITLAGQPDEEPMPQALREKLYADARLLAPAQRGSSWPWLAAAACLVLAIGAWFPRMREVPASPPSLAGQNDSPATAPAPQAPSPAELRRELLASAAGVVSAPWSNTDDPASAGVTGDIVWDNVTQRGYMRFSGLAANNPNQSQYQLWIFDARQDERYPIDGGVFDVPPGSGEVIVPIRAALTVREPVMFAVTVEKPGGVVVSSREHIVTLAKTPS